MLIRKVALVGLTIAVITITGCIPQVLPGPTATARPTETAAATATATPTATATAVLVPSLGPLPSNNDLQLPFPGYKEENYTVGWNSLKDDWNRLWTKWGLMTADQLGSGGSLMVRPVDGETGIVCENAVDGSYKGITLCPPLDLVNGGLLPFPGIDSATNTNYYPLFIQRSSQFARMKSVGTSTGLVLQEVDSSGKPTRYIKPKNDAEGNGGGWIAGEYKAPIELPSGVSILSSEEMAAKGIIGTGLEIDGSYQNVPMKITIALSKTIEDQYGRVRVCDLNPYMGKVDPTQPAEVRALKLALLGNHMRTVREMGATEDSFPFDLFVKQLAGGKVFNTLLYGKKLDGSVGIFPFKPGVVEFVEIALGTAQYGDDITTTTAFLLNGYAYQQLANGGFRIVYRMDGTYGDDREFCMKLASNYEVGFGAMGSLLEAPKGMKLYGLQMNKFPKTSDTLNKTVGQTEIYTEYGQNPWMLVQP